MTAFGETMLSIALQYDGVRESRPNRGETVDLFIRSVGIDPEEYEAQHGAGPSWCAAFVHFCGARAAASLGEGCPVPKTAGAIRLFQYGLTNGLVVHDPRPGDVFAIDHGMGKGHVGIVTMDVPDKGHVLTIEGNTNGSGGRNGDGVYRRTRPLAEINLGFVRFATGGGNAA